MEQDDEIAEPVVRSVLEAVRQLGLDVRNPTRLGVGSNVVLRLDPYPVVARVATLSAEMRGGAEEYLLRERVVSTALHRAGLNVVTPTSLVEPGPHSAGGYTFLLLTYRELKPVDLASADHARAVGRSLTELLVALADLTSADDGADDGHPWEEMSKVLRTVEPRLEAPTHRRLVETIETLQETEPNEAWQLVHGDAHRVNVAFADDQIIWFDFEHTNKRPLIWDLATLRRAWPAAGDEACRILGVATDGISMRWHFELRELYALLWNLLYAERFERARKPTADRLAGWLLRPDIHHLGLR